jgi:hypothetical protein
MLAARIEWILLFTGLATCGALLVFLAPDAMVMKLFGQPPSTALHLIARHWGLLVFLIGGLLIYSAYHAEVRVATLVVAIVEKAAFALGVFISPFRSRPPVFVMAVADACMATVYLVYLVGR